jgi:hypothetical protein
MKATHHVSVSVLVPSPSLLYNISLLCNYACVLSEEEISFARGFRERNFEPELDGYLHTVCDRPQRVWASPYSVIIFETATATFVLNSTSIGHRESCICGICSQREGGVS